MNTPIKTLLLGVLTLGFAALPALAQRGGKSSDNDERLKRVLQRFPEADADKDGVLSFKEFRAFREKRRAQGGAAGTKAPPAHAGVKYGKHERHVLDLWLAKSDKPTPCVLYIHGGGFVGGDKGRISSKLLATLLEKGISVASINYRLVTQAIFPACFHDGARAVQFLRSNAARYNLDKSRFGAFGNSAGAGMSLWLGYHADLADAGNADPVLRESTRLQVVGSIGGQSSYDPGVIKAWIGGRAWEHSSIHKIYGKTSPAELTSPDEALQKLYDECSAIRHLTKGDPPTFLSYKEADKDLPEGARPGQGIHHPRFAHKLAEAAKKLGVLTAYRHKDDGKQPSGDAALVLFLAKHLGATAAATPEVTEPSKGDGAGAEK